MFAPKYRTKVYYYEKRKVIGEILIKQVVLASVVQKAVGVIDPVIRRMKMQQRGFHQLPFLSIRQN